MIPNPIHKVLSTLSIHAVQHLVMGGQACVLYGAAEFTRDTDIVILAELDNLNRLQKALNELQGTCIAFPPFALDYLRRGHAVHFRCLHPEVEDYRIDVMAVMRGVDPFEDLWSRRSVQQLKDGTIVNLVWIEDLVRAKKTKRDKDWHMIRRLVESHYARNGAQGDPDHVCFWLRECRTPAILLELAGRFPAEMQAMVPHRPLLNLAQARNEAEVTKALRDEEDAERQADQAYWAPLLKELEQLRHQRRKP